MSEFKDQFNEVLRTTLPISIAILVLNTVLVGATPWEFVIEVMCIGLVLIGFTLFLYGVNVGIMPMGKAIGLKIAQRDSIPIMIGLVFMIGLVVTIAEPDVTVFTSKVDTIVNELDGTALTISIAVGVSVMMVVAALRMVLKVPLKYVVAVGYALVIILGLIVPEFILGIAFDSGGVTTGPITVPVMMALGVGIGFVASKGGNQMDNFGMIGLASIGPLITVMLYGQLAGMTEVNLIPGSAHVSPVDLSFVGEMLRNSVIDTLISVIPLMLIFIAILKFYVHTSWSDLKVMSVSVVYTAAGMILFLTGVYAGFMPLSEQLGVYLVVNDVNIEVKQGEIVGLLGPNGAGKTTTFYMVVGLIKPYSGSVFLDDQNISDLPMYRRAQIGIGYLAQEASVFRQMTVEDNIYSVMQFKKDMKEEDRRKKLEELLEEFGLDHVRKSKGIQLSGGERRRTEIARALAVSPNFILLDEPFAGVDPIAVEDIQRIIFKLKRKNIGVLITDHNVHETLSITDRAYLLFDGKVLKADTPENLAQDEHVREVYLGHNFVFHKKEL